MTRPPLNRTAAISQARLAQGACAVVLAAGATLGVIGLPGAKGDPVPETLIVPEPTVVAKTPGQTGVQVAIDTDALGARMSRLDNAPKVPEVTTAAEQLPTTIAPPPPTESKYIGSLSMGERLLAILIDAGIQRVAKVGDTLADGAKIVAITHAAVTVEHNGARRDINLAKREGDATTRLAAAPAGKGGARPVSPTNIRAAKVASLKGGRPPGTPDGSPERLQEIIRELRGSGNYKDDNSLNEAAKEIFQAEAEKFEKGGPS